MFCAGAGFAMTATTLGLSSSLIRKHKEKFWTAAEEAEQAHLHLPAHVQHELQFQMQGSFEGEAAWSASHNRFKRVAAKVPYKEGGSNHVEHGDEDRMTTRLLAERLCQ